MNNEQSTNLSMFNDNISPKEDLERKKALNLAVLEAAIKDIMYGSKEKMASAAYFLFAGDNKLAKEKKDSRSFENYCRRLDIDPNNTAALLWEKLNKDKQLLIKQIFAEVYNIDLPDYLPIGRVA